MLSKMLTIRQARAGDCDSICTLHRSAILHTCAQPYGQEAAQDWARQLLPTAYEGAIAAGNVVVVEENGQLLGFTQFDAEQGEIDALYAHPEAEKRGIASALLVIVEDEARARGLKSLRLRALASAEVFYAAAGYATVGPSEHCLPEGAKLPCIRMEKHLDYEAPRPERRRNGARANGFVEAPRSL